MVNCEFPKLDFGVRVLVPPPSFMKRRLRMKEKARKEMHYEKEVWVNPTTESLRKDECLCLNCNNLKPGQPDNCSIAQVFYKTCVKENVALLVTRCPLFEPKGQ